MAQYSKAIIAAVSTLIATLFIAFTNGDEDSIATIATATAGAITTILVYLVPNKGYLGVLLLAVVGVATWGVSSPSYAQQESLLLLATVKARAS